MSYQLTSTKVSIKLTPDHPPYRPLAVMFNKVLKGLSSSSTLMSVEARLNESQALITLHSRLLGLLGSPGGPLLANEDAGLSPPPTAAPLSLMREDRGEGRRGGKERRKN